MDKRKENYMKTFLGIFSMVLMIYIGTTTLKMIKVDITEENLYTLSSGTKSILNKLDSKIQLKLYYSKTAANKGTEGLRAFNNYSLYVIELLKNYVANSHNNLSLEIIDPRPDTEEEESAVAFGLKKFSLTETESYFFGLVAENESGLEKVIDFFDPNQKDKLEYQLTKLIYTVLHPQKKTIGIISSLEVISEDVAPYMAQIMRMQGKEVNQSWISIKMLKEFYQIKKIENNTEKISGIDALLVIHPTGFEEKTLFAIDQYLLGGGNILLLVDPNSVSDRTKMAMGGMSTSPDAGFKKLMDKWGVELVANSFAGDKYLSGTGRVNPQMPPTRMLALLNCDGRCSDRYNDPIASSIKQAMFVFPGVLKSRDVESITQTPILATTDKGNSYTAQGYELNNPRALWNKFSEGSEPVIIGRKLFGKFETAFPDGIKTKSSKKTKKNKDLLKKSSKDSAIVVFSDVDFIADQFAFKNTFLGQAVANDNSAIFLNSVEAITGDVDLMSVRSKGKNNRSFDVIEEIEFEAEKKTSAKVKEINGSIARFQSELNQLGRKANKGNIAILQNEGIRKKKQLAKRIAGLKKELREVKRVGREKIEQIGKFFQYLNTLVIPFLVIIAGIIYSRKRKKMMKQVVEVHNEA